MARINANTKEIWKCGSGNWETTPLSNSTALGWIKPPMKLHLKAMEGVKQSFLIPPKIERLLWATFDTSLSALACDQSTALSPSRGKPTAALCGVTKVQNHLLLPKDSHVSIIGFWPKMRAHAIHYTKMHTLYMHTLYFTLKPLCHSVWMVTCCGRVISLSLTIGNYESHGNLLYQLLYYSMLQYVPFLVVVVYFSFVCVVLFFRLFVFWHLKILPCSHVFVHLCTIVLYFYFACCTQAYWDGNVTAWAKIKCPLKGDDHFFQI